MSTISMLTLGLLFLLGLVAEGVGRYTRLPRVTLLLLLGIAVGPHGFGLIPQRWEEHFGWLSALALTMVGFLLGGKLARLSTNGLASTLVVQSLIITAGTFVTVLALLWLVGVPMELAALLASVALATDPAATMEVVQQHGDRSHLAKLLLGIVALDDAWGLIVFSMVLAVLGVLNGHGWSIVPITHASWEIGGALGLGLVLGLPLSWAAGQVRRGEATTIEAVAIVFLCCGLSLWLEVSYILAAMSTGFVMGRVGRGRRQPFHEIAHLEWPVVLLFFILVGASLDPSSLASLGWMGACYVAARVAGRVLGAALCVGDPDLPPSHRPLLGLGLLPQAGVAIGVALVGAQRFPEHETALFGVVTAAVVLFELVGPVFARRSLRAAEP